MTPEEAAEASHQRWLVENRKRTAALVCAWWREELLLGLHPAKVADDQGQKPNA